VRRSADGEQSIVDVVSELSDIFGAPEGEVLPDVEVAWAERIDALGERVRVRWQHLPPDRPGVGPGSLSEVGGG
jgi:hypothetical protein